MNIKIEHGIPIPDACNRTGRTAIVNEMKVGDSTVVDGRGYAGCYAAALRRGLRLIRRSVGGGKFRCWLVERKQS